MLLGLDNGYGLTEEMSTNDKGKTEASSEMEAINDEENEAKMRRGELYYAFTPRLAAARTRCFHACNRFNFAGEVPRRRLVELWREYVHDLLHVTRMISHVRRGYSILFFFERHLKNFNSRIEMFPSIRRIAPYFICQTQH